MPLDIKSIVDGKKIVLVMIPNVKYPTTIMKLAKALENNSNLSLYISLNKLYETLIANMKDKGIDTKKFCFIDAITKTIKEPTPAKGCAFVASPNALTEMSLQLAVHIEDHQPTAVLFDSLSTLLVYDTSTTVTRFVHSLIQQIRSAGSSAIFTALEGDTDSALVKQLSLFVDEVIKLDGDSILVGSAPKGEALAEQVQVREQAPKQPSEATPEKPAPEESSTS
ncbi:RAD55 family ATPase [Candidatus Undinarchaeota archaeon]